jgi:hypothetical protein
MNQSEKQPKTVEELVAEAVDRYETRLKDGVAKSIEEVMAEAPQEWKNAALAALLESELEWRGRGCVALTKRFDH